MCHVRRTVHFPIYAVSRNFHYTYHTLYIGSGVHQSHTSLHAAISPPQDPRVPRLCHVSGRMFRVPAVAPHQQHERVRRVYRPSHRTNYRPDSGLFSMSHLVIIIALVGICL